MVGGIVFYKLIWAASWQNQRNDVHPAKTQISLCIRPVWSESSLCAQWVAKDPSFLHADSEDSDQPGHPVKTLIRLGRCPGWFESSLGAHAILLVLSRGGSFSVLGRNPDWSFSEVDRRCQNCCSRIAEERLWQCCDYSGGDGGTDSPVRWSNYSHSSTKGQGHRYNCKSWHLSLCTRKQTTWCEHSEDSDQPRHLPSLNRVFAVCMKKAWVLSYPLGAQWRLIRLGGCPGWSESSLGAHVILLVLWCGGSFHFPS